MCIRDRSDGEFGFESFATEYYGRKPTPTEAAAIAVKLHSAPVYFNRKGKGRYKAAPAEILKAALAGLEKKRLLAEKMAGFVAELKAHRMPDELMQKLDMLLYAPDKNSFEYKTLDLAANELHVGHLKLLQACGAIPSVHNYHLDAFLREHFAKGTGFASEAITELPSDLPLAEVEAFSIDDSATTEIDDAFSIQLLGNGMARVGIHIAAPALGILPDSPLDIEVMQRLSTVYMPCLLYTSKKRPILSRFIKRYWRVCWVISALKMVIMIVTQVHAAFAFLSRLDQRLKRPVQNG